MSEVDYLQLEIRRYLIEIKRLVDNCLKVEYIDYDTACELVELSRGLLMLAERLGKISTEKVVESFLRKVKSYE
ncbi:MAG: hypothetical protein ACXQTI_08770 [Candidatus Nezhaarchaeales archaeon]